MSLLAAELRKLTSARATWALTLVGLALIGLQVGFIVFGGFGTPFSGTADQVADALAAVGGSLAIPLVVALLAMTTEFRHGTIGRTLQITPSRTRVLVAKLAVGVVYALLFVALGTVVVAVMVLLGASYHDVGVTVGSRVVDVLWQAAVALALTALLGVAFGAVVRSQVMAITTSLVWIFVVETLLAFQLPRLGRWMPFQALGNLFVTDAQAAGMPPGMPPPLAPEIALLVFVGWVVLLSAIAIAAMRWRDV